MTEAQAERIALALESLVQQFAVVAALPASFDRLATEVASLREDIRNLPFSFLEDPDVVLPRVLSTSEV